jgi:hypothetical protein
MRRLEPDGVCSCCGSVGPVLRTTHKVLDFGTPTMPLMESRHMPDLCDTCDYAQRRWEAWHNRIPGYGYPYLEGPPLTPPVRLAN